MSEEKLFSFHFPAKAERLTIVRALVKKSAELVGCPEEISDKLVIALNEACMNVIQHAYKGNESGEIILEILNNDSQLIFILKDFASPVDLTTVKSRELDDVRPGGLGVHFIKEIMDDYEMGHIGQDKGNYLQLKKNIA